ncbi:MAG: DinB family protein [Planctomycetes bacterium]|nr:DinB family protein [Planctomycetota bacterium]
MSAWPAFQVDLRARLGREFAQLSAALAAPGDALRRRPEPNAWSALEVVEHVALTNHFLSLLAKKLVDKALARSRRGDPTPSEPPSLAHLDTLAARAFRWQHPTHMTPTGSADPIELRARLAEQHDRLAAWLDALPHGAGSLHRIRISVVEGDDRLDFYQLLHFVLLHVARHRAQLARAIEDVNRTAPRPDA